MNLIWIITLILQGSKYIHIIWLAQIVAERINVYTYKIVFQTNKKMRKCHKYRLQKRVDILVFSGKYLQSIKDEMDRCKKSIGEHKCKGLP